MSCSTLIGATAPGGGYTVRWLHWGGHPNQMVPTLRGIWRHTFARSTSAMGDALLANDWSSLDETAPRRGHRLPDCPVLGVGYTTTVYDGPLVGHVEDPVEGYLEWMYLVDVATDTVVVYEATCHSRWVRHSHHDLDPDAGGRVLGCGGYTDRGHRWTAAQLRILGDPAVLPAEVCTMPHPAGLIPVRFRDSTAGAIAARTAPSLAGTGPATPRLRRVGTEFDVIWPDGRADQPQRLRRDADGQVLLPTHPPLWSWQVLPHPTDTETEPR